MAIDVDKLIRDSEELIAQAEAGGMAAWCKAQGLDPEKFANLSLSVSAESQKIANELFADDLAQIKFEVELRAREMGIVGNPGPAPSVHAAAVRQRRRLGMV